MGIFDSVYLPGMNAPNLGWLSQLLPPQKNDVAPGGDILNPTGMYGSSAGHASLSDLLGRLLPPVQGGAQQPIGNILSGVSPAGATPMPSGTPVPPPQMPPMPPPINVPTMPQPATPQMNPPLSLAPQDNGGSTAPPAMAAMAQGEPPGMFHQISAGIGGGLRSLGGTLQEIGAGFNPNLGPQLQETGTDPFTGQKTFAWINHQDKTITPAAIGAGSASSPMAPMGAFADAIRSGVGGDELLKLAPPEIKNRLQAMLDGREAPPTAAALRNPQVQALINAAHAIDPSFDETTWGKRFALIKNYQAGGKQFQEMQAIGTVSGHLTNLMKSADALDNTSIPMVNGVMNWVRQNTGDPRVDKLNTDIQAVTTELSKAYKAGHVSDADVRAWRENINAAKSPAQFKAVIGELNDLLRSKRETLESGYQMGMGKTPLPKDFSSESEKSRKNFESVADWSMSAAPQAAPPSAAAPPAQSAPITATGPNGQRIVLKNGQWVPLR